MREIFYLLFIFLNFSLFLYIFWAAGPTIPGLKWPANFEELRNLASELQKVRENHHFYILSLFSLIYIYKQCFAIPGSFFMNLLAGAIFGFFEAIFLVPILNTIGASLCFILSRFFAKPIIERFLQERIGILKKKISSNRHRLWIFLLSARLFPFTPHWFLNISSPFLEIPLIFHITTIFLGCFPYNFVCVSSGTAISQIDSTSDVFSFDILLKLIGFSLIFMGFAWFSRKKAGEIVEK
ncbi:unnamed protein product [Caenorhabditis angaria]|uniref:VTT domain-containing protein n=1 Tax=Caenorhabditis angaria TaxID=860376 RepID=A0A9P1MTL0_9PELO|nr:unnamed protein product [Caenorhabditis angaria]